jgi:hypothetical protein
VPQEPELPAPAPRPSAPPAIVIETKAEPQDDPADPAPAPVDLYDLHGLPLVDVDGEKVYLGREDDEAVWKTVSGQKDALMQCHLDVLGQDATAGDFDVALVLVIESSGKVKEARAESTPRSPGFEVCILAGMMKLSFAFEKGFVDGDGNPVETAAEYDIPLRFAPAD